MRSAAVFSSQTLSRRRIAARDRARSPGPRVTGLALRAERRNAGERRMPRVMPRALLRNAPRRDRPQRTVPHGFLPLVRH